LKLEALESFVTLARTQQMNATVKELGITRQTVNRHLEFVNEIFGSEVMYVSGNQRLLTDQGKQAFAKCQPLVDQAKSLTNDYEHSCDIVHGLQRSLYQSAQGQEYRGQQHPLWRLWIDSPPMLGHAFKAAVAAQHELEHESMLPVKPFMQVHRRIGNEWICAHVGAQSAYRRWFGSVWCESAVGTLTKDDIAGLEYSMFAGSAYDHISDVGGFRLDHNHIKHTSKPGAAPVYVRYQRLLMGLTLPDGSPVLGSIVAMTNSIDIQGFSPGSESRLNAELVMDDIDIYSCDTRHSC
jgi:hypothetical protein